MERSNEFLGTEHVGRLMGRYAVPCVISLLVGALYNIVDQIFIANADYLGSYGNAANTVVFPLTVVALAIAVMVGDGCCAFVSMALGPVFGQEQYAQIPMAAVGIVMSSVFQALGEGLISLVMSATRQLVFLLPLAFLLAKFSGLAAVWASIPLAEVVGFALALLFYRHIYNHKIAHIETVQFD